jgi:hypothetical protein
MTNAKAPSPDVVDADADVVVTQGLRGTRALLAVAALFAVNGVLIGGFGATLPAMRERLGVGAGGLAVLLVSLSTAAVLSSRSVGGWPTAVAHATWHCRLAPC